MRLGRLSSETDQDGDRKASPFRLPIMKRHRQPAQEVKENVAPEDDAIAHERAVSSSKASKRRTVIDFFKHKGGQHKAEEEENDNILTRMTTQKTKSSNKSVSHSSSKSDATWTVSDLISQSKSKHQRNSSSYGLSENALDRILGPSKDQEKKKASDNFFLRQQIRADSRNASGSDPIPPFYDGPDADVHRQLTEDEIFMLFEGAPCFSAVPDSSEYRPQVVFHGGSTGLPPHYLPDHKPFDHETFRSSTLGMDTVEESQHIPFTSHLKIVSRKTEADDDILEVPNLLSANGPEPGTTGFEHFLQLPVSDSLRTPDESSTFEKRHLLIDSPAAVGLLEFDLSQLVNRLTESGELHSRLSGGDSLSGLLTEDKIFELGDDLFGKLLDRSFADVSNEAIQKASLDTQIAALQQILETKGLWHDFSIVEWRIRIGQLLWTGFDTGDSGAAHLSERDVFILQVTLAAELLVRLKLLAAISAPHSGPSPVLLPQRSQKVKWDIMVAERFLSNMSVSMLPSANGLGIRNSFFSAISFFTSQEDPQNDSSKPVLRPKNEDQQIAGLLTFARALSWPHVEDVRAQLRPGPDSLGNERPVSMMSVYATPLNSPRFFDTDNTPGTRTSYFGAMAQQQNRPGVSRTKTAQIMQLRPASNEAEGFNVGGWLSRSWLSGLVLPGEAAGHFLMSALLENSPEAIDALGDNADLYGGFAYRGRTFWSKSSAVGRVLAAKLGTVECMGWISVPDASLGQPEGWIDTKIKDFPYPDAKPRIKDREALSKASDPFHNYDASFLRASDFTTPIDSPPVMGNEVVCRGLSFASPDIDSDASSVTPGSIAHLTFSSPINPKLPQISVPLTYDVHFISSYPCYPVANDEDHDFHSLTSSPSDNLTLSFHTASSLDVAPPPAHPLHTSYRYMTLPVATLLSAGAEEARSRALSLPDATAEAENEEEEEVAVLDCRGKADLELLARAWCAKVGENAIVGKTGRTCLACCIREARGLGVRVLIRT